MNHAGGERLNAEWARRLRAPFGTLRCAAAPALPGGSAGALAQAFHRDPLFSGCVLAVAPNPAALEAFLGDAEVFRGRDGHLRAYPMLSGADDTEAAAARLSLLRILDAKSPPPVLIGTCVQALLQPSPDPRRTDELSRELKPGPDEGPEALVAWLEANGYQRGPEVYERGIYAVKGGIVDVWPTAAGVPSRIEYFGDDIESLRTFHPETQRSDQPLESLRIPPRRLPARSRGLLHHYLPDATIVLWLDWPTAENEAAAFAETGGLADNRRLGAVRDALDKRAGVRQFFFGEPGPDGAPAVTLPLQPLDGLAAGGAVQTDPEVMAARRRALLEQLFALRRTQKTALFFCLDTAGAASHLRGEIPAGEGEVCAAPLSGGFQLLSTRGVVRAVFAAQCDLYGFRKRLRGGYDLTERFVRNGEGLGLSTDALEDLTADDPTETLAARIFENFAPGDLVVHMEHGIGRYRGTTTIDFAGERREVLVLEYANGARLLAPLSQANLITRYTGVGDLPVRLHTLGGRRWNSEKLAAAQSVQRLALEMLTRQARRKSQPGHAFDAHTPYFEEFEASFPYRETEGQAECIRRVLADMQSAHPMDRLVCGDAGYGKTEIALRAAFVAAMQGKQVALLVPTTVLAQQHYETFRSRLAPYPLTVALHSRFVSPAARTAALEGAATGAVDILIGTHGILGPGVTFRDLGLVIIDEEQRFGVRDKERLKEICEKVDVLTLSATPIPRTLYLGLTGLRDLSLLRTPPPGRVATETTIAEDDDEVIRKAVLREIGRGGQVFFLHNRVLTLDRVHARLRTLFPHLRIGVGHGQLRPRETDRVMREFADGRYDILLSTTIVENGIDIPRANTILIDRADRFGIADLYQLRGRVGRGSLKAYAIFLVPHGVPLTTDAKERLQALASASQLGTGVSLALRDLSIRGSGNLLGAEQSGHISAVGFTLYCQLLRRAVAQFRGQPPPLLVNVEANFPFLSMGAGADADADEASGAYLPHLYIAEDSQRIQFHRRLAECASENELQALRAETEDRFGASPAPLRRLYTVALARILSAERNISRIDLREGKLYLYRDGVPLRFRGKLPHPAGQTPQEILDAILRLIRAQTKTAPAPNPIRLSGVSSLAVRKTHPDSAQP